MQRTPLEDQHTALGAKLGSFAGWNMPIEYEGTLAEHRAVREAAGMFDVSHLGKVEVVGPGAMDWLQRVVTNDLRKIELGQAQYNMVLNDQGGIVDDLIVYWDTPDAFLVVPNASNIERILGALTDGAPSNVTIRHRPDLTTIAVQGPSAPMVLEGLFPGTGSIEYMHSSTVKYRDEAVMLARSGYTGEKGYELFATADVAPSLWEELLEAGKSAGLKPCGLGARDTLRLEMGYALHGNDISEHRTPLEAGLSWAVSFDKGEFRGSEALKKQKEQGIPARLRALRMEGRLIPRAHYPVFSGGSQVGETTSGTFSPTLKVGIALAYLSPPDGFAPGQRVEVDVRGRRGEAEVVKPPFVDSSPK
ncbi:MAG: glycine cleavage system aminomethyltransferase GcvT [Actinomycetota bacterium]